MRREFGWPLVELGNIRLRRGDLAGAEEAFLAAHERTWSPHPGLALLRLEQGEIDAAATMIADAIAHPFDIPSKMRPPFGDLRLAPLLDAQAEIATAAGDADTVRLAADALAAIADSYPSRSLEAERRAGGCPCCAGRRRPRRARSIGPRRQPRRGRTSVRRSRPPPPGWCSVKHAIGPATPTGRTWSGGPRRAAFDSFGAMLKAERGPVASSQDPRPAGRRPAPAVPRRRRSDATATPGRSVSAKSRVLMRDLKGLRYIERLLADPGREIHVLDLVAVERGSLPTGRVSTTTRKRSPTKLGAGLPVIDDAARDAYRRRLAEVDDDIEEATRMNDLGRVDLAERDREYLIAELTSAVGLGGRTRSVGGIRRARPHQRDSIAPLCTGAMAKHHPALAAHLEQSVHTGTYCVYNPDPIAPLVWDL